MIKLKQLLFESTVPDIFIPRRLNDRVDRYIKQYIRDGGKGKLSISYMNLTKLPDILKNMKIDGDFSCEGNYIESLENFPKSVGGAINLAWNTLKSLEGLNIEVVNAGEYPGESFNCKGNYLTDLKGGPKVVKGNYNCGENDLVSLEGSPEKIEGNFYCGHNQLKSLVGGPIFVTKDFSASYNHLESLDGLPKFIGGNLYLMSIHKKFTAQQIRAISDVKGKIELV
jgi:hypothetical protein